MQKGAQDTRLDAPPVLLGTPGDHGKKVRVPRHATIAHPLLIYLVVGGKPEPGVLVVPGLGRDGVDVPVDQLLRLDPSELVAPPWQGLLLSSSRVGAV